MKYKVGQKYRIMTLEEAEEECPHKEWNKTFFDYYAGTVFTIERINDRHAFGNLSLFGTGIDGDTIQLRTEYNEDMVLKPFSYIELENSLFDL